MYHGYEEEERAHIIFALNKIKDQEVQSEETPSVYILSRFNFRKPEDLKEIQKLLIIENSFQHYTCLKRERSRLCYYIRYKHRTIWLP